MRNFPVLVADVDGKVAGYASYGDWRTLDGFRHSAEHSVYVHRDHRGAGLGRDLMTALIEVARERGIHVMIACVEAGNAASIRLHESLGFRNVGTFREVGTKFGRWLDLTCLELRL
jgi:phosphinothricin acetyltransferase